MFDLPDAAATPGQGPGGRAARRLQHFWLCGSCSQTMMMVQNEGAQIQVQLMLGKVVSGKALQS